MSEDTNAIDTEEYEVFDQAEIGEPDVIDGTKVVEEIPCSQSTLNNNAIYQNFVDSSSERVYAGLYFVLAEKIEKYIID